MISWLIRSGEPPSINGFKGVSHTISVVVPVSGMYEPYLVYEPPSLPLYRVSKKIFFGAEIWFTAKGRLSFAGS